MSRGVNIPIAADASSVIREGKKVEGALEPVIDSLDDVGDASKEASRVTEKSLDEIGDEAEKQSGRVYKTFKEDFEKVEKKAKTTGKQAGKDLSRGVKDGVDAAPLTAKDVFRADLKAELVSNAAEAGGEAARGLKDGFNEEDMSTILDGVSDTVVAVGAMGGPIGIAGGLAASSAMQLLVGPMLENAKEDAAKFEATFTSAFDNIVEAGAEMGRELTIQNAVGELVKDVDKFNEATTTASLLGVSTGLVVRAMAGDTDALDLVTQKYTESLGKEADARQDKADKQAKGQSLSLDEISALDTLNARNTDLRDNIQGINSEYANNTSALDKATDAAAAYAEAQNYASEKAIKAAQSTAASTGKAQELEVTIDGVTESLKVMPSGKVVEVTDEGTAQKTQLEIDAISGGEVKVKVGATTSDFEAAMNNLKHRDWKLAFPVDLYVRPGQRVAQ